MADTHVPVSPHFRTSRPSEWSEVRTMRAPHRCAHCNGLTYASSGDHGHHVVVVDGQPRRLGCGGRVLS